MKINPKLLLIISLVCFAVYIGASFVLKESGQIRMLIFIICFYELVYKILLIKVSKEYEKLKEKQ